MSRLSAHLVPLTVVVLLFALVGAAVGFVLGEAAIGALFGAVIGVLVFVARINSSRAVKDSPEGEDAGYIRRPGGDGGGFGGFGGGEEPLPDADSSKLHATPTTTLFDEFEDLEHR